MSFIKDFNDANNSWNSIKKEIEKHIKGDLTDIETKDSELANMFDRYSGIDAIQVFNKQMRGVAIRVQWGVNYKTFSIRFSRKSGAKTEYQKRTKAIFSNYGYWYPYLTIQIYLDNKKDNNILNIGVVKTLDLYEYIFENMPNLKKLTCPEGNQFLAVSFDELKNDKRNIIIF
ncbi:MAG: hypothetical protein GY849_02545 [Deltaproteobacteria bacterium]|nr:hypothetical protein [Deltaproteobacteria bacterium]